MMVAFLQLALVRRLRHVRIGRRLAVAVLLMGIPFLALSVTGAMLIVVVTIILFTLGEIAWAAAAQMLIADMAPAGGEGRYLGVYAATLPAGTALGPLVGLRARSAWGDTGMWYANAGIALMAGSAYLVLSRFLRADE